MLKYAEYNCRSPRTTEEEEEEEEVIALLQNKRLE